MISLMLHQVLHHTQFHLSNIAYLINNKYHMFNNWCITYLTVNIHHFLFLFHPAFKN